MATKKQLCNKQKVRKKMSKEQMQLAIIKKKQCDAKALAIVEQLLEPDVNSCWLLENLGFINKNHMEDVIEERAITKLCGYVLCCKPITIIVKQQYHISIRRNKVYDISKRKHFCSSTCYAASNFLLQQILESPLWLREKEEIPIFQILHTNPESTQCMLGDEVDIAGTNIKQDKDAEDIDKQKESTEQTKQETSSNLMKSKEENEFHSLMNNEKDINMKDISVNTDVHNLDEIHLLELHTKQEDNDSQECVNNENEHNICDINETNIKLKGLETQVAMQFENTLHLPEYRNTDVKNRNENINIAYNSDNSNSSLEIQLNGISNNQSNVSKSFHSQSDEIINDKNGNNEVLAFQSNEISNGENKDNKEIQHKLNEACSTQSNIQTISSESLSDEHKKKRRANRINKNKKTNTEDNICFKLTTHVEQSVKEWVTKNTLCLLLGEVDERYKLLESLMQHERYQQLCKKLNRLQLRDKQEDRANLKKNIERLKALPDISVLEEEGKKIELKVRAFYEGRTTIVSTENESKNKDTNDSNPILPLTEVYAPNALRRKIFLDKLSKILPDLLRALTANANTSTIAQYTCNNEKYSLIKLLINTFNLSATNIVFKTAEWTLVGLVIIKMLSLIDTELQSLLGSKQATIYTSMILTSYKLDPNYLDRFIMEVLNNVDTEPNNT